MEIQPSRVKKFHRLFHPYLAPLIRTSKNLMILPEEERHWQSGLHPKITQLQPRVMMNRIWRYHFGRGIVRSSSDFGYQGDMPTHPKLLDWLAIRFMKSGWDIKAMHKLIMSSDTYRRSSAPNDDCIKQDHLTISFTP